MKHIEIYTDGGCSGNPGPGGWAFILKDGERETALSGGDERTTNNRMELTAVISALEHVFSDESLRGSRIDLYTDSQYVKNGITTWIYTWQKNGWQTAAKKPVKNRDLWMRLDEARKSLDVSWHWVKGHAGHEHNEAADALVGKEIGFFLNR